MADAKAIFINIIFHASQIYQLSPLPQTPDGHCTPFNMESTFGPTLNI